MRLICRGGHPMPLKKAYLGLGSNLGDRLGQMRAALELLELQYPIRIVCVSPIYENRAIGMQGDDFLNAVAEIATDLDPQDLLDACLFVESSMGRKRLAEWTSRPIDLDILLYENIEFKTERLTVPHSQLTKRDFVIQPLLDIAPGLFVNGRLLSNWLKELPEIGLREYPKSLSEDLN